MEAEKVDNPSKAEMDFWREWADKAPALLRAQVQMVQKTHSHAGLYKMASLAVGAVLGVATFTKKVSGKWKWVTGIASAGSLATSAFASGFQSLAGKANDIMTLYTDRLEQDPKLRAELAEYLSHAVDAASIQQMGIEQAVVMHAAQAIHQLPAFRLEVLMRRDFGISPQELQR